jgi:hypothetical protein
MKTIHILFVTLVLSTCSKIDAPSFISPSLNMEQREVSYGDSPDNYQKVLKDYLIKNLKDYKTAKVEFINEPTRLTIDHLGDTYAGYRLCLSINEQRGEYYMGYRNHFFMINDSKVTLHLFDSGLLTIPFEYCVTRDKSREFFIDQIPEEKEDIMVEKMDEVKIVKVDKINNNIYISCNFSGIESTYIFNETKNTFKLFDKLKEESFTVSSNDAFIVANKGKLELSINRVSGKATYLDNSLISGECKLADRKKF